MRTQGLFPSECEIARRLSQTAAEWAAKAAILERDGLPRIDPLMGGRYWPAVEAYWRRRYGLHSIEPSNQTGRKTSMRYEFPGLKRRLNKDGRVRLYWVARADIAKAGYRPKRCRCITTGRTDSIS